MTLGEQQHIQSTNQQPERSVIELYLSFNEQSLIPTICARILLLLFVKVQVKFIYFNFGLFRFYFFSKYTECLDPSHDTTTVCTAAHLKSV